MTNLIITSPRPNQLVSGLGEITWVDLDGSDSYQVEIALEGTTQCQTVDGKARRLEVNWDTKPCCNAAKVIVRRKIGEEGAETGPLVIPRHLPPIPHMVLPENGEPVWSDVLVSWSPVMRHNVDGLPFRALVQSQINGGWVDVLECSPTDDVEMIDCRQFQDGPVVLRVVFENEVGTTTSSESTINVIRQGGHYIDTKPPCVDVSHVVSGGKISFSMSGKDEGSGVSMLRIKQDNEEWGVWIPFSSSFEINAKEDGIPRFFFQFVDHAGNMAESTVRMFQEVYHNATICSKVGNTIVAACDSLVVTPGKGVVSMPGKITCLGSYKGMTLASVENEAGSSLVQASDPPAVLWSIPSGRLTHMVEGHGTLYLGCDNGNIFSFCNGSGFLSYVAEKITSMDMVNGSLIIGCAKQGLICFDGTTWEKP